MWNPSKEKDFPGTDLRYEDNFDAVNNLIVTINPTSKSKITDFGGQDAFLNEISYILGNSAVATGFESKSEGGFKANTIAAASILGTSVRVEGTSSLPPPSARETCTLSRSRPVTRGGSRAPRPSASEPGSPSPWSERPRRAKKARRGWPRPKKKLVTFLFKRGRAHSGGSGKVRGSTPPGGVPPAPF